MSCSTLEHIVLGSTYYWLLTAYKDDVIWDISAATITHYFKSPSSVIKSYSMTILVAEDGTAYHVNPTTTFNELGKWEHTYKVVQGDITLESEAVEIVIHKSVAALA